MKTKTLIIDYGVGNLLSLTRALEHVGSEVVVSDDHRKIDEASHVSPPWEHNYYTMRSANLHKNASFCSRREFGTEGSDHRAPYVGRVPYMVN